MSRKGSTVPHVQVVDEDQSDTPFDPVLLAVMANRINGVCRQMTNTLLRSGRSSVLALARDFSCSIVTANNELLESAEGLPVHVIGSEYLCESMTMLHKDLAEGDAFLHNDPYMGNTHHGDHSILVPVFWEGRHVFTTVAKAHQADCGNSLPTTYMPTAVDIYQEGALNFPCVRIQREMHDNDDIIRMCRRRIRVPEVWYGDYLAQVGAARIGERALKEFIEKYGWPTVERFVREWFDYSERRMTAAVQQLSSGEWVGTTAHDPFPGLPEEGIPLKITIQCDAQAGTIDLDLRDNPDCVPAGINQSRTTAINQAITGVFNSIDPTVPHNAGSFRRLTVQLRENCVAGIPIHPTSCSMATSNIADRIINMTQAAFAAVGEGLGLAEGCVGFPPIFGVISGVDRRYENEPWVTQPFLGTGGGPAGPNLDGWVSYLLPVAAGLIYRDSIEVDEQKYPIVVRRSEVRVDSEGAGRSRGAPGNICEYGPRWDSMMCFYSLDGTFTPPKGVRGGQGSPSPSAYKVLATGAIEELPDLVGAQQLLPGECIGSRSTGGGGYGDPFERDPAKVLADVREGYISVERARSTYGVVLVGDISRPESLRVADEQPERGAVPARKRA